MSSTEIKDNEIKEIGRNWWLGDSDCKKTRRKLELEKAKINFENIRLKQDNNELKGINAQQLSKKVDLLTSKNH